MRPPQHVLHAAGLELEHAVRQSLRENLRIRRRIVQRQLFQLDRFPARLLDQLQRVVDNRQRRQPEEVHLEKPQLLQHLHLELRDNFVFVGLVQRNDVGQRHRRNHYARRMHAGVPRHPLQPLRDVQHLFHARVLLRRFQNRRLLRHRLLQRDLQDPPESSW